MTCLRVAACQLNPIVGDLGANVALLTDAVVRAASSGAQLVVLPEMAVTGYPVEDLLLRPAFAADSRAALDELAAAIDAAGAGQTIVVVGYLDRDTPEWTQRAGASNSAAILFEGKLIDRYDKHLLPNYGVFDEDRWFVPGDHLTVIEIGPLRVGVAICEDLWWPGGPAAAYRELGIDLLVSPNASPFSIAKPRKRRIVVAERAFEADAPVLYVNLVGGQDELVFDGDSFLIEPSGRVRWTAPQFVEDIAIVDVELEPHAVRPPADTVVPGWTHRIHALTPRAGFPPAPTEYQPPEPLEPLAQVWGALVTGLRDYVHKTGFRQALLGLSGGIDSALVAVLAADALGADNVFAVSMPSKYSSQHSRDDAAELAARTGIHYRSESIEKMVDVFVGQLNLSGLGEENIQARCRGMTLMAISNMEGQLVLATGNKSELAVGYSTIYGDAVGAYGPIRDVPKTLVFELARWRNRVAAAAGEAPPIPENSIDKPPSAELRPEQKDSDSLPEYPVLDDILERYVELDESVAEITGAGHDPELVRRIAKLIERAEYKRRQYPLGTKITRKAFGRDRRMPITNRWHDPS